MSRPRGAVVEAARFGRANLASAIASGLEWLLVSTMIQAGIHYLWAAAAGAVTGAITDFSLKRWWAFDRAQRAAIHHEGARYVAASASSLLWNLAVSWLLVERLGVPPTPGVIAASVIVGVAWNYPLHRWYVFREALSPPGPAGGPT